MAGIARGFEPVSIASHSGSLFCCLSLEEDTKQGYKCKAGFKKARHFTLKIASWCNGSTSDPESLCLGSSPSEAAIPASPPDGSLAPPPHIAHDMPAKQHPKRTWKKR